MIALSLSLSLAACSYGKTESFDEALARARDGKADQVAASGDGIPFYTTGNLNPVWREDLADIVRIPRFQLVAQDGKPRGQEIFQGKLSVVGFFFASCHGLCPVLIQSLKRVENAMPKDQGIQIVALTVDPEHDNPGALRKYASHLKLDVKERWTLLTGDKEVIYGLARETFASQAFRRQTASVDRNFVHSEHLYVIDPKGRLRGVLNGTRNDVAETARKLIAQLMAEKQAD